MDIGTVKNICIVVRFYDKESKQIESKFWELINVFDYTSSTEKATAEKLFNIIIDSFKNLSVSEDNIIGFGSDGCNIMMGPTNSVSSRFKQRFGLSKILKE